MYRVSEKKRSSRREHNEVGLTLEVGSEEVDL
jgi:hypothetical protein